MIFTILPCPPSSIDKRFVGFDFHQQQKLAAQYCDSKEAVLFDHCELKKSRYGDEMEVLITSSTSIASSPRKFDDVQSLSITLITLEKVDVLPDYQHVSLVGKVLKKLKLNHNYSNRKLS